MATHPDDPSAPSSASGDGSRKLVVAYADTMPVSLVDLAGDRFPTVTFVPVNDSKIPEEASEATVLFRARWRGPALAKVVAALPRLSWLHSASAGLDQVLIPEVVARGLTVTRTARARAAPIAEFVLATTLALVKKIPELLAAQQARRWQRPFPGTLAGATVGIVGAGAIGRATAQRFRAFGTRVIGTKASPTELPEFDEVWPPERLDELLEAADVVVLACPLTKATRGLIDGRRLALMMRTAILVNVARGAVVVQADLIEALRDGVIAGAVLDVFKEEPLPAEDPLWGMPNVIVSPHASSAGPGVWEAGVEEFLENLERFLNGEALMDEQRP